MSSGTAKAVGQPGAGPRPSAAAVLRPPAKARLARLLAAGRDDEVTRRILDTALVQFETFGLRRSTMLDIARAARLARKTVYRRFANKDALIEAVLVRELTCVLSDISDATSGLPWEDRLVEGLVVALRAGRSHPLLNRVLTTEPEALPYLTTLAGEGLGIIHALMVDGMTRAEDAELGFDVEVVTEGLLRFAHSYVLTRNIAIPLHTDSQVRAFARRYIAAVAGLPAFR